MKKYCWFAAALAALATSDARAESEADEIVEPPTLLGSVSHVGGYGGPSVMYSRIAGRDGVLVGGEGALLLNHRWALGGAGYGWTREMRGPADADGVARDLEAGYGGVILKYSIFTGTVLYGSAGALVGGGGISLTRDAGLDEFLEERRPDASDAFFVVEPQLSLHVNLLKWMRMGLQGGYRITSGLGRLGYSEGDLNGVTLGGTIQFGRL